MPKVTVFLLFFLTFLALDGCATKVNADGQSETRFDPRYLVKTEIDRVIDANRAEVMAGLRRVAGKLYRRNPAEWKKAGQPSLDAALDRLFSGSGDFPELNGRREGAAALYAFSADYTGDRVLAVMTGLIGMVDAAFEHKDFFYALDGLDEQKLYNCARNVEIAVWKMSSTRAANGQMLMVSNELDREHQNLSFEREFGRVIGLLDFLSRVVADRNGRFITRVTQGVATAVFLPVGALGFP
ncbi:MAG: hypothetical protein LBU43_03340 [Candidatus Accumulibacter sp.]|jgi:hypothetical protein|nr:hypothetical protein [Accumulibacter sp.]